MYNVDIVIKEKQMHNYIETTQYCPLAEKVVTGYVNEFDKDSTFAVVNEMKPIGTMVEITSRTSLAVGSKFRKNKIFWGIFGCEYGWTYEDDAEYNEKGDVVGIKKGTRIFTSRSY